MLVGILRVRSPCSLQRFIGIGVGVGANVLSRVSVSNYCNLSAITLKFLDDVPSQSRSFGVS